MSFVTGSTAFGFFDADTQFQVDADKVLTYVTRMLGESQLQVEISSSDVYTCFEAATMEFSSIINMYQAKSTLGTFLGSATGSLVGSEQRYPQFSLEWARRQAEAYNDLSNLNSRKPYYSGSVDLSTGQQDYDLQTLTNPTGSDGGSRRMVIKNVYHYSPGSAFRFFGTTSFMNYLNNEFKFESYTPETVFHLLPVWEDILRGMQFKVSNKVRRSNYSYELHNNILKVMPIPAANIKLWFTYQLSDEPVLGVNDQASYGVSNMSNLPFGNIRYSAMNSISRRWIFQMTLALCKQTLGYVRRKMGSIPVPNGEVSMDGDQLVSEAQAEMERLRQELTAALEDLTYDKLAIKEAEKASALEETLKRAPLMIYVG